MSVLFSMYALSSQETYSPNSFLIWIWKENKNPEEFRVELNFADFIFANRRGFLYFAETNFCDCKRLDFLAGYKFFDLQKIAFN